MKSHGRSDRGVECTVTVRFHQPPAALRTNFTTFYVADIDVADGAVVTDWLHPEWANLRISRSVFSDATITQGGGGVTANATLEGARSVLIGPTSRAVRFATGATRIWGVGFLPLGWARYFGKAAGLEARDFADGLFDAERDSRLAHFRGLSAALHAVAGQGLAREVEEVAELAAIGAWFKACVTPELSDEARIQACHAALVQEDIRSVAELAEASGMPAHTLERVCRRHFGFAPQLLLRRQRFMRSLARYMLDPTGRWTDAIDGQYYDQAQFVRDFHRFMGLSPSDYAARPHPVLAAVMKARQEAMARAVQTLDPPKG